MNFNSKTEKMTLHFFRLLTNMVKPQHNAMFKSKARKALIWILNFQEASNLALTV